VDRNYKIGLPKLQILLLFALSLYTVHRTRTPTFTPTRYSLLERRPKFASVLSFPNGKSSSKDGFKGSRGHV